MNRRKLLKLLGLGGLVGIGSGFWFTRTHANNPYYSGPVSDHFDGRIFFNPNGVAPGSFRDLLKWQLLEERADWPETFESKFEANLVATSRELKVTMIGHATLLIQVDGVNLITDPVFSDRASPFQFAGPGRVNPPGIDFEKLPKIDVVLVSHNHYDHLDLHSIKRLVDRDNSLIVTPLGNDVIIKNEVPGARCRTGDWGDTVEAAGVKIHFEPCHHWSARGVRDRRMALWAAFVVETQKLKIYHVGDTGFHRGINYQSIAEKYGGVDLAILPVGAYEPRWFMKGQHQTPEEAVAGFKLCAAGNAIGHHWGTFQLTNEAIEEPVQRLNAALQSENIDSERFVAMAPGQEWHLPENRQ